MTARFFKTGPGDYAAGDIFIGITVPTLRRVAREHEGLALPQLASLLKSKIHEERHLALLILTRQATQGAAQSRRRVCDFYLHHTEHINNWDLVDCSAPTVVGGSFRARSRQPLQTLAHSAWLWDRRIAIVATQYFIRHNDYADALAVSQLLLHDSEDLIHKATGWTLREVGKKEPPLLRAFLDRHDAPLVHRAVFPGRAPGLPREEPLNHSAPRA
jgi:3-methyladenine DNA glycosylase AlkD